MVGKVYDDADVWFNFGLIDKAPIDQVIQDWDGKMATILAMRNLSLLNLD